MEEPSNKTSNDNADSNKSDTDSKQDAEVKKEAPIDPNTRVRYMEFPDNYNMKLHKEYLELINYGTTKQNRQLPKQVDY